MRSALRPWLAAVLCGLVCRSAGAQDKIPPPAPPPSRPLQIPTGNAAVVNGQAIAEKAVFRSLRRVPLDKRAEARTEVLNYLIDNLLVDQEMHRRQIVVDKKDVDDRVAQIRAEVKKDGKDFDHIMKELLLTEEELRAQITADLRWDKYVTLTATETALKELFGANKAMFDGSLVHARHILIIPAADDKDGAKARAKLAGIRQQIEKQVTDGMAKRGPDKQGGKQLKPEEQRAELLTGAFADAARKESACPSKANGGDLGWFPRAGRMVEPFAKAAFALKPYELSDTVASPFGLHLILVTETKPGKAIKYEDVRDLVKEVYGDRLREALLAKLRPAAKIVISPAPKQEP